MNIWERYTYRVFWSDEDGEFVATCAELPGISWLDKDPDEAIRRVREVAKDSVKILEEDGDDVPEPIMTRKYSGEFRVRIPPETHRRLVLESSEANVSLNRLVSEKLAR